MEQIIIFVGGSLLSVSAVSLFVTKAQVVRKYLALSASIVTFVDRLLSALSDHSLTEAEIKDLSARSKEIKEAYLLIRKK